MRRRGKVDSNHAAIVRALRQVGASVLSLADIGNGCPDLLVAIGGRTVLLEVKDENLPPSKQRLTPAERVFFGTWAGAVTVVHSVDEALLALKTFCR